MLITCQKEVKKAISLDSEMIITNLVNVKHWYGANKDLYFSHTAVEVLGEEISIEWCELANMKEHNR